MAKRKEPYSLQKVTINLRLGDWKWLQVVYGTKGAGKVIRDMVMGHVDRVDESLRERMETPDE